MHSGGLVVGANGAAAPARSRPDAGRAAAHVLGEDLLRRGIARMQPRRRMGEIERLSKHCAMAGYYRYAQALRALRDQEVTDQRLGWRQEATRRRIGRVFQTLAGTVNTDQQLDPVVIRSEILIADGPIEAEPVPAIRLEIVGPVAEGNAPPVIGAATEHSGPPP